MSSDKPVAELPATLVTATADAPVPKAFVSTEAEENLITAAPAQPPRPLSPQEQNQATLVEAFPNIDAAVVKAVLVASRGDLEPAFNALLSMSDPSAVETPPPQPPRPPRVVQPQPQASNFITSTPQNQLDADALYARQLQEHYGSAAPRQHRNAAGQQPLHGGGGRGGAGRQPQRRHPNDDSDDEYYRDDRDERPSFFEEDLPVIKENIKKGFLETQTKVTGWFNEFKKRIDGEDQETSPPPSARTSGQYTRTGTRRQTGLESAGVPRRSRDGYDADNKVLSDDFLHLSLKDSTASESAPRRPKANPNLFQPSATTGRRVSFEDRPKMIDNDNDLYRPSSASAAAAAAKRGSVSPVRGPSPVGNSKWEPLKSVEPEPLHKDPFSLEDSDDEKDGLIKETETTVTAVTKPTSVTGPQESGVTKNP